MVQKVWKSTDTGIYLSDIISTVLKKSTKLRRIPLFKLTFFRKLDSISKLNKDGTWKTKLTWVRF